MCIVNHRIKKVDEKVVVISGGTGGFGECIVREFLSKNMRVAYSSKEKEGENSDFTFWSKVEASDFLANSEFAQTVFNLWGRIDVAVINAGINKDKLLTKVTEADIDEVLAVNLKGFFCMAKNVLPYMVDGCGGHIIAVSSYVGSCGREGQSIYCASKSALHGAVKSLAKEVGCHNIKVNAVMPGFLDLGMGKNMDDKILSMVKKENALGRLAEASESAGFIYNLSMMNGVSGQLFNLDSRILGWV